MSLGELEGLEGRFVMPTYRRAGVEFVRGIGARLWDSEGREYLDFFAGLSVHNAGHCHPRIVEAIRDQSSRLMGVSNLYHTEPGPRLAQRIAESSLGGKVFLCNSGAEASECAIKLVRKHAHGRGIESPEVVVLDGAFHGRTLGALAATPKLADEDRFGPLPAGFVSVARDDPDALRAAVGESTAAVMIEPIQGEAGVWPVSDDVLSAARKACDESGAVLVFDEVQTGMGRTGSLWAHGELPARPDVMTAAKALGGGLPVGACVTTEALGDVFEPGDHGSTFAGAPVTAAAALAMFDVIDDPDLMHSVRELGRRLSDELRDLDGIEQVRGRGLMLGAAVAGGIDASGVVASALDGGLVINNPAPGTLRFLPPLTITAAEVDEAVAIVDAALGSDAVRHAAQRAQPGA